MAMSTHRKDREQAKFKEVDGNTHVRIIGETYSEVNSTVTKTQADLSGSEVTILSAPGAGNKYTIRKIIFSTDTAGKVKFISGSTDIIEYLYFAANSGITSTVSFETGTNEAFKLDTDITGNFTVFVEYN